MANGMVDVSEVVDPVVKAWEKLLEANEKHYTTVIDKIIEIGQLKPPEGATPEQSEAFFNAMELAVAAQADQIPANSEFRVGLDELVEITQTEQGGIKIGASIGPTEFSYITEQAVTMHSANSIRMEVASATGEMLVQAISALIGDENLAMILQALQDLLGSEEE